MDADAFSKVGEAGVDMVLVDSTNGMKPGRCGTEASVVDPLMQTMKETEGCVFLTTFSSNLWRLMTVIDVARRSGRKVFLAGMGIETTLRIGAVTGLYEPPTSVIIPAEELCGYKRHELCILISGCQAEYRSGIARLAAGEHRDVHIEEGDRIIFSSRVIPGNERALLLAMDRLKEQGAEIVTAREHAGIHVSGHAFQEDIRVLAEWIKPKYFVPVHGSYTHLTANHDYADSDLSHTTPFPIANGQMIELRNDGPQAIEEYQIGYLYIDSETHVPLDFDTMRKRHRIGELGGIWISGAYSTDQKKWVRDPELELAGIGLPAHLDPATFFETTKKAIFEAAKGYREFGGASEETLREEIRIAVRRHVGSMLGKKPVVMALVSLI